MCTSTATIDTRPTRGLKNRNPGNLRWSPKTKWLGQAGQDTKGFAVFVDDVHGIRALVIDLHTDYVRDHQTCVLALISEYAPPNENDTRSYSRFVAERLGVGESDDIPFDRRTAVELTRAIIHIENGLQPYPDTTIERGVELAFAQFGGTK